MWKINNLFNHFKKSRSTGLAIVFLFVMIAAISFWVGMWTQSEQNLKLKNPQESSQQQAINEKIESTFSKYACEAKKEMLVKGFIEKLENDQVIVNDGVNQTQVNLKSETVFVRISIYPNGQSELAELPKTELKPGQDVVLSAFANEDGSLYTLLVKQIVLKNI